MIAQQGRIVALDGEDAVVRVGGRSGCTACDAGKGCGAGIFGRLLKRNPVSVEVPNTIGADVGNAVEVGISEERFLALVGRLYIVPLVAGLGGAAAGYLLAGRFGFTLAGLDLATLAGALAAAAAALAWTRHRLREFPLRDAVHLVRGLDRRDCMSDQDP